MAVVQVAALDAGAYQSHSLHALERAWPETNCYVDLWIELLNGLGHEPLASLAFVFETDFEGDHFTFFKQPHDELRALYGVTVQELPIWRPVLFHIVEQVSQGRPVLIELDSYYLPDTHGTAYKTGHTKTTVGVQLVDVENKRLGYFHNRGYYELSGEDFDGVFRLRPPLFGNPDILPPYVEVVKPGAPLRGAALIDESVHQLRRSLARRPTVNPVKRYRARLAEDVKWLMTEPMETYHLYVFNTFRQLGASFELGEGYLRWLGKNGVAGVDEAIAGCAAVSAGCKTMLMVLARAVARKKLPDLDTTMSAIEAAWDSTLDALSARFAK